MLLRVGNSLVELFQLPASSAARPPTDAERDVWPTEFVFVFVMLPAPYSAGFFLPLIFGDMMEIVGKQKKIWRIVKVSIVGFLCIAFLTGASYVVGTGLQHTLL